MLVIQWERPWLADFAKYLCAGRIPYGLTYQGRKWFFTEVKYYIWDDPFNFNYYPKGVLWRCVPKEKTKAILAHCHSLPCGGHHGPNRTAAKVLQCTFYRATLFKDAREWVKACGSCQDNGSNGNHYEMPQISILEVELFDVQGLDFMRLFPNLFWNKYILVAVEYASKWVEALALPNNTKKPVVNFVKKNIFRRFRVPRAILGDNRVHFTNVQFSGLLSKYGCRHHLSTNYHLQ